MPTDFPLPSRHLYSDEAWLELMIHGLEVGRADLPSGPPDGIQALFVGWSGQAALRECFGFYKTVKAVVPREDLAGPVLDFGVGWGRLIRLFAHDADVERLYGVDVDPEILAVCEATGVPGNLRHVEPGAPLPFVDGAFRFAYAYSVFSHLSEDAAATALQELSRVVAPGGRLTFTTQGMRFLALACAIRDKAATEPLTEGEASVDTFFVNPHAARARFLDGGHAYTGTGGGEHGVLSADFYGWAAVPPAWIEANAPDFEIDSVTDDPAVNEQVIFTLRRR